MDKTRLKQDLWTVSINISPLLILHVGYAVKQLQGCIILIPMVVHFD